jgi:hypothetical protein
VTTREFISVLSVNSAVNEFLDFHHRVRRGHGGDVIPDAGSRELANGKSGKGDDDAQ